MPQSRKNLIAIIVAVAAAPLIGWAQGSERTHEIVPEDYFSIEVITDCAISPDGKHVAFVNLHWEGADEPRSTDLWVVNTESKRMQRLTFEHVNDHSPQWGPDGQHLYFVTKRDRGEKLPPYDGSKQVWVTGVHPGEPFPVTRVKDGIRQYQISKDGRSLYYTKSGEEVTEEWKDLRKRYSDIKFGSGPLKFTEFWKLDLETWREERLVAEKRVITEFEVAPDESRIAMVTTPDGRLITKEGQSRVDIFDAQTKEITTLPDKLYRDDAPSPYGWVENLAWSSDAGKLAWTVDFDGYPGEILVAEFGGGEPTIWMLTRPDQVSHTGHLHWIPSEPDLCFTAEQRARQRVHCIRGIGGGQQGEARVLTPGDFVVHSYSFSADGGQLAFVKSDTQHGRDVFVATREKPIGQWTRLTDLNPHMDTWKLPQISLVTWNAPDGTQVEGILELPPDYTPDQGPLPMVVELHGGPTAATLLRLRFWIYGRTLMAAKGYALLSPNYRGSTGYGDEFLTGLIGRENDVDVKDILSGVDAMVERGIADPERLGVMGWSNGGFLANAIITTTTRFKAASTGAGVVDQLMQWGLEDTPGHVINYMRGLPWERADAYIKASAAYQLGNVTTPTLIHVGEKDARVPAAHCRTLYRGLKDYVGVPTVLLTYPGAGHGLTIRNHRKAKMEWDLAWYDRYLLEK